MTIYSVLRHIVRNDAIRVDPPEVYNWRVLALTASVCLPTRSQYGVNVPIACFRCPTVILPNIH